MKNNRLLALLLTPCINFCFSGLTFATDYYVNDFESGAMPSVASVSADQEWSLTPIFVAMYGPGNHFKVTDASAHSGTYSLQFTYEGRNGFCNTCGTYGSSHKQGLNNTDYFVADNGEDLTLTDNITTSKTNNGPAAQPGRLVFNKTNGYSQWRIQSVTNETKANDKLILKLIRPGINGDKAEFNDGDKIAIARQCGVDGHVGGDINRRSDCDSVVTWFGNVTAQSPGSSIFRRLYLKQEVTSHFPLHQKLHYFRPNRDGTKGSIQGEIVLFGNYGEVLKHLGSPYPQMGLGPYGGSLSYRPTEGLPNDVKFERSTWYYVEEEYKASTFNNVTGEYNKDGEFRLWFAKSGEETDTPVLAETGLQLPALSGGGGTHISLWGNTQHWIHNYGSWYMDDIHISDTRVGWIANAIGKNIAPANSPLVKP